MSRLYICQIIDFIMRYINNKEMASFRQIVRFFFSGGISTLVYIAITSLLVTHTDQPIFFSHTFGFLVAYLTSFVLHLKYVFLSEFGFTKLTLHFLVQLGAFLISIYFASIIMLENVYYEIILISISIPTVTFFVHKIWTFSEETKLLD